MSVSMTTRLQQLVTAPWFTHGILILIILNAAILGLETSPAIMAQYGDLLLFLDNTMLAIFVVELLLRMAAYRTAFFRDSWNLFDLAVVTIALVPASGPLAVLRSLRVLRVLRVLSIVPSMRRVISALLGSLPGLGSIGLVLILIYYVFAVIATKLFGDAFPEWFGSIAASFYTLFQVMTLESWSMGISRPVMEQFPYAWMFFVPFILIATFTMLNLFIAIIVNTMQTFSDQEHAEQRVEDQEREEEHQQLILRELQAIRAELAELRAREREGEVSGERGGAMT